MSASPIATGGAGVHLESWIIADHLAATLTGGAVRGLPAGSVARAVRLQRAFEGAPLDDLILTAADAVGPATLSLQVKRSLTFGDNPLFREVMDACWQTFNDSGFQPGRDRFGVALGVTPARLDQAMRPCLRWARDSVDAADFFRRIGTRRLANEDMRRFVALLRQVLADAAGQAIDDDRLWAFLRQLVVLTFDFELGDESTALASAVDRLRYALPPEDGEQARTLWQALVDIADRAKASAGGLDRAALVERLEPQFRLAPKRELQRDLERIREVSQQALDDIRSDIGGIHLPRSGLHQRVRDALGASRLVEVVGEAGLGKSALLKTLAQSALDVGPVLFLSARRLPTGAPGWQGLASLWRIDASLPELLVELATQPRPCLFIDGIERLHDPGAWLAVNDLLRGIRQAPSAKRWRIVISARSNSLDYRIHLDLADWDQNAARLAVGELDTDEIAAVAAAHPPLAALIEPGARAARLAARPFLLERLLRAQRSGSIGPGPVSELDLMLGLWQGGACAEPSAPARMLAQQDVLLELGQRRLAAPQRRLTSVGLDTSPLLDLERDDLIRHDSATRQVTFTHDIIEDWVLCQALCHDNRGPAATIEALGQPLWLLDAVSLLAQWRLEGQSEPDAWLDLLAELSRSPLQPRWRRAVLTAPFQSTRAAEMFPRLTASLWADGGTLLRELMLSMRTIEVEPDPLAFDETALPDCDDVTRMQITYLRAAPRPRSWRPFFGWLVHRLKYVPLPLIDETSRVLETWARALNWFPDWVCPLIARWSNEWLERIDRDQGWTNRDARHARLDNMGLSDRDEDALQDRLRFLLLTAASGAIEQVRTHLRWALCSPHHRGVKFFIEHANLLVESMPVELVDFLLAAMCPAPREDDDRGWDFDNLNTLGIEYEHEFFQASHLRPPFLLLLRQHPEQGLLLINALCNHAMTEWRSILIRERRGTPLPLRIRFPWGEREFWGHAREYTWFRGIGPGPYSVMSALMALEVWLEEQVAAGADLAEVFQRALEGNRCVGAVGACVSVALANPGKGLEASVPLLASPQLWRWDIERYMHERGDTMSNLIGLPRDRIFLRDVAKRNRLPHRKRMLRDLAGYYVLDRDQSMRSALLQRLADLEAGELPFDFAEHQNRPGAIQDIKERIQRMRALLSPENWQASADEQGQQVLFAYQAPEPLRPSPAEAAQSETTTQAMKVALWAQQSMERNALGSELSMDEAVAIARGLDCRDLFDKAPDVMDFPRANRIGAVSGAAAMAVQFADPAAPAFGWGRAVIQRAAATPLDTDPLLVPAALVAFHPVVFGAWALAKLVERGVASDDERRTLLRLVTHPLHKVIEAVFGGLAGTWRQDRLLCWQVFALGMRLCAEPRAVLHTGSEVGLDRSQAADDWIDTVHADVVADWRAGRFSALPRIPLPWIQEPSAEGDNPAGRLRRAADYRPSEVAFRWDLAPLMLTPLPVAALLVSEPARIPVLRLVEDLLAWTIMDQCSPLNLHHGGRAYRWSHSFLDWCAKLSGHLDLDQTNRIILDPLRSAMDQQEAGRLLEDLLLGLARHRFAQDRPPDTAAVETWRLCCELLFDAADGHPGRAKDRLRNGFDGCVPLSLFCYGGYCMFEHPWPALDAVGGFVASWVERFAASPHGLADLTIFLSHAGRGLLPDPGLGWIEQVVADRGADAGFWKEHDNGSKAAELLLLLLENHASAVAHNQALRDRLVVLSDVLISVGVRRAAMLQQELAKVNTERGRQRP
jgi:hypothetical protein